MQIRFIIMVLFVIILVGFAPSEAQLSISEFDKYVGVVMKEFEVPGLCVAVVKDGKVVAAKGYGEKKLGENAAVDGRTLFNIASNTKAFTATALAILVEEGKLAWDTPVIRYLPWFRLADPYVTQELTVKDLLVHRSGLGLGAGDLLWWPASSYTRREIAERLQFIPLTTSFRSAYAYDNVLYLVAGEVIKAVTDSSWEEFVASRILKPLGMTGSKTRLSEILTNINTAMPHAEIDGKVRPVTAFTCDNANPAAGILTNAVDIAKWMIVQLDSGRSSDTSRLFSRGTTRQLWAEVTPVPFGEPPPGLRQLRANFNGYALGFGVRDYRGRKVVSHTGGMPGYLSRVTLLPEDKLGIAVLLNHESGSAFNSITYYVIDKYLKAGAFDWTGAYKTLESRADTMEQMEQRSREVARDTNSRPSLPIAKYMGTYRDDWYGDVVMALIDGKPTIKFSHTSSLAGELVHWQYDTFIARWYDRELRADAYVTFSLNPNGLVDRVKMEAVSSSTDFSFDFHDLLLKPVHPD
jgi:CubicO group peptidase (beta-lactamase class C family)